MTTREIAAYRDRLGRLGDEIVRRALLLRQQGRAYPPHWRERCQALNRAWCRTYGRAGW